MKKLISFLICIMICLSVCACSSKKIEPDTSSLGASHKEQSSSENVTTSDNPSSETKTETETSSTKDTSSKKWDVSSKKDTNTTSKKTSATSSKDNGSKNNSSKVQNNSSELEFPLFEGTGLVPGKDFGYFTYDGTFASSAIYGDIVYSVYKEPNILVVYDTKNLKLLANVKLPAVPHEIQVTEDKIMISFPRLRCVGIYSKTTYEQTSRISVEYEIGSFCMSEMYIYYTEPEQDCHIYKKGLGNYGIDDEIINRTFHNPKIAINTDIGILYIGESGSTGSALYYYDLGKKKIVSTYKKDNRGMSNSLRTLFLVGDSVYWAGLKFDAKSADIPSAEFSPSGKLHFANDKYIVVSESIYDINTYQLILMFNDDANHISITESENLVLDIRSAMLPHKVIIIPA